MELCYHIWRLRAAYKTYEIVRIVNSRIVILPTFLSIIETVLSIEDPAVGMVI